METTKDAPAQPPEPEKPIGELDPKVWHAIGTVMTALSPLTYTQATNLLDAVRDLVSINRPKGVSDW